jgi:uncharacterized protein (DUF1330 family)
MNAHCFFDVRQVFDGEKLSTYQQGVRATVERHGGRYLLVGGPCELLEGVWRPVVPVLIQFPDAAHARSWYRSPEYRPLRDLRIAAADCQAVLMEGAPSALLSGS